MTVENSLVAHETIRFERTLSHPPPAVFAAYAEVDQRVEWTAPTADEVIIFETEDFQVGGVDQFICGTAAAPELAGTTRYEDIVENERIVFTERLVHGDDLLAMSLVTWTMSATADGCTLVITDQVTSVAGQGPVDGSRAGYDAILDRLVGHLSAD